MLSRTDVAAAASALEVLASPLDFPTVDAWRAAVNRKLRTLLHADSAGFMLPSAESGFLFSEEHDPVALARYPDLPPPTLRNGQSVFEAAIGCEVSTVERTYGADFDVYLNSEYYNEYAGANGAHDTLFAFLAGPEIGMAGLQFWHEHPTRRKFGSREIALL